MINLRKILCPVDLSKGSLLTLRFANAIAGRYRASLTVIHVLENPHADIPGGETGAFSFGELVGLYKEERQEEIIDILKYKGHHAVSYEIIFKEGTPYNEITDTARKIKADMIIMSTCTSGKHGMGIGSTTERTVRFSPCPVLSIQADNGQKRQEQFEKLTDLMDTSPNVKRTILLPTDFSEHSVLATKYAISLAKEYKAELIILHVIETIAEVSLMSSVDLPGYGTTSVYYNGLLKDAQERVKNIREMASENGVKSIERIIYGNPRHEILDIASTEPIDLIVIGTHGRKGFSRFINGSVAEAVVRHAQCSVLSVKNPEHDFI
ncbi:MAG: universal stress protein [Candidatus Poribacteria bacterium]